MRVLVTGAFGNVGRSTVEALLEQGHQVRCFDLRTPTNERQARRWDHRVQVVWGDLRNLNDIMAAMVDQEVVAHIAFIIPKLSATGVESETRPDWARAINVGGTRNLIEAMRTQPHPPKLIFTSSLHIYGRTHHLPPPRTVEDPLIPVEHYSQHKVECEQMIRASGLAWAILRLAAVLPLAIRLDPGMFDVPLDNRMEFVHTRDVGLAIANAVACPEVWGKTLHIGGGPGCQLIYRDIVNRVLEATGPGRLREDAFTTAPFPTDWLDTSESQRLLHFQRHTFDDYIREMQTIMGARRHAIRALRPIARAYLLRQSPYVPDLHRRWRGKVAVVTGASSGIGAATAERLAREGLRVVLIARREDRLEELAAKIRASGGEASVLIADLSNEEECVRALAEVQARCGSVDVLVNSAGMGWYGFGADMPWESARQMIEVNMAAAAHLILLCLPEMRQRDSGHIINVGSVVGSLPSQGVALYSATKSFLDTLTTSLYRELRGTNVHVSVIRPGAVTTEFWEAAGSHLSSLRGLPERLGVAPDRVADRIWAVLQHPRRVAYVPGILRLVPWVEMGFGWLIDRIGPLLLRAQSAR